MSKKSLKCEGRGAPNPKVLKCSYYSRSGHLDVVCKKVSQNSQKNICARVSFLIKLEALLEYLQLLNM